MSLRHCIFILSAITLCLLGAEAASRVSSFALLNESQQRRDHRTTLFRTQSWIIGRRGGTLNLRVTLDSALAEGQSLSLQVSPFAIFDASAVRVNHVGGGVYDIRTMLQHNSPVGTFSVGVRLSDRTFVTKLARQIFVLYNPWNPLDLTHYPNTAELEEYVNNEHGITYRGTSQQVQDVRWAYNQFDHSSLLVSAYIVNKLGENARKDAGLVARHVTAMMTQQETKPDGMMIGKWEGGFAGGTNPSSWSGSSQIINQYISRGMRPVSFSQCWVFGAVYQTVSRALGIPTRQVAAFDCAHEKPEKQGVFTQSLPRYWDRNTRSMITDLGAQIWNFHSFNEIWIHNVAAPMPYNLPEWHTVDATPQEHSDGQFQLGPANVRAIREKRKVKFDTSFVISEISARYHNYLVSCPFFFGRSNSLPPSCSVVQDMGPEPHFPTGTYIVAKSIRGFTQDPLTHRYHTRNTGGMRNAVRAFDVSNNGVDVREEREGARNYIFDQDEEEEVIVSSRAGSGNTVGTLAVDPVTGRPMATLAASASPRSRRNLMEKASDSGKNSVHHSLDTGLAMGIVVTPVSPGEPIDIVINLGCEDQTKDLGGNLVSTDRARRHIVMRDRTGAVVETEDVTTCPERVLASLRAVATFSSQTGTPGAEIANVKSNVVLHEDNDHFASVKLTLTNYVAMTGGVRDGYVSLTVFATDHSTGVDKDIILFGQHSMAFLVPKVVIYAPSETIIQGDTQRLRMAFTNPLTVSLTNAKLHISADNLGFEDLIVDIGDLSPMKTFMYTHNFDTASALEGMHFYHAIMTSDNLVPAMGEVTFTVKEK